MAGPSAPSSAASAPLTARSAGTAVAGAAAPPRPYRTLQFTTMVDDFPIDIELDLSVEGTPPRTGRAEERVLFMTKLEAAEKASQWVIDWLDPNTDTNPQQTTCSINAVINNGEICIFSINCSDATPHGE